MTRPRLVLLHGDPALGSEVAFRYAAAHPAVVRLEADEIAVAHLAAGRDVLVTRPVPGGAKPDDAELVDFVVDAGADPAETLERLVARLSAPGPTSGEPAAAPALTWPEVAARLSVERSYWLGTTAASGAPQVTPVWGAVLDETLHLYSERHTAKARNLARDPRVVLHLADPDDVLIVHGAVEDLGAPTGHPEVMAAFRAKYAAPADAAYLPDADPAFDVLWALRGTRALTWRLEDFEHSRRSWDG